MDAVLSIAFSLFGAAALAWGLYSLVRAWQSGHWPTAIGTIVSSAVEQYHDRAGQLMFRPGITYRYMVSGKEYVSGRRIFGGEVALNWPGPAEDVVARHPPGSNISVRYNPRRPGEGVLEPGQYRVPLFGTAFGALFLLLGLWLW